MTEEEYRRAVPEDVTEHWQLSRAMWEKSKTLTEEVWVPYARKILDLQAGHRKPRAPLLDNENRRGGEKAMTDDDVNLARDWLRKQGYIPDAPFYNEMETRRFPKCYRDNIETLANLLASTRAHLLAHIDKLERVRVAAKAVCEGDMELEYFPEVKVLQEALAAVDEIMPPDRSRAMMDKQAVPPEDEREELVVVIRSWAFTHDMGLLPDECDNLTSAIRQAGYRKRADTQPGKPDWHELARAIRENCNDMLSLKGAMDIAKAILAAPIWPDTQATSPAPPEAGAHSA